MNRQWRFVLDGPLVGYQTHQHPNTDRARRYVAWKAYVRLLAFEVPSVLDVGLAYEIVVSVRWKKGARIDADNLLKGITDSLWKRDRNVLKASVEAGEYTGEESATVTVIERWVRKSTTGGVGRKVTARGESGRIARASVPANADPYSAAFRRRTNL